MRKRVFLVVDLYCEVFTSENVWNAIIFHSILVDLSGEQMSTRFILPHHLKVIHWKSNNSGRASTLSLIFPLCLRNSRSSSSSLSRLNRHSMWILYGSLLTQYENGQTNSRFGWIRRLHVFVFYCLECFVIVTEICRVNQYNVRLSINHQSDQSKA